MEEKETQHIDKFIAKSKEFFSKFKPEIKEDTLLFNYEDFSNELKEELEKDPERTLEIIESAIDELDNNYKNKRLRFTNIPKKFNKKIEELRAKDINKLVCVESKIVMASEIRPQVVNAKFECPSCGKTIQVLQVQKKFKEPTKSCKCGRKGNFRLVSKEMVDARRIVIADTDGIWMRKINDDGSWVRNESDWDGEETGCRLSVFLQEDLCDYEKEKYFIPGNKLKVFGILKEIPISLDTGGISTRFELAIDAWNVWPVETE